MVEESRTVGTGAAQRTQNAIKAAFFGKSVEIGKPEDQISLRYSDLRATLRFTEGALADKTLSSALKMMVEKNQLERREKGREVYYRLTIPRTERLAAFAKSDAAAIQNAAQLGGMGDLTEGWSFYGVPDVFREKVRGRLRRASSRFRNEIIRVLDRTADEAIGAAIRTARGKMPRTDLWKVEDTLYRVTALQAAGTSILIRGAILWSNLETIIPGSLSTWKRVVGMPDLPEWRGEWTDAHLEAFAKALGIPPEELRNAVARENRRIELAQPLLRRFIEIIGPEEADRFGHQLGALVGMFANLTAVTRV